LRKQRPKLLVFASPDNPTGHIFSDAFVADVVKSAAAAGCFVAIDFAYADLYYTARRPRHFSLSPRIHKNLVKIYSNSKWCRGLGRRIGWVAADAAVADALALVQQSLILSPDTLHQLALADYLQKSMKDGSFRVYLRETRNAYREIAGLTASCIEQYLGLRYLAPNGGLYITVDAETDSERFCASVLKETGVIFVPARGFGTTLTRGVRISFGPLVRNPELIRKGLRMVGRLLGRRRGL
ncbi:MAG: aminotransferase class I/II-fold pyridoxal phosphate-dependent enzyme, partial [Patescibacteria group bacterium]